MNRLVLLLCIFLANRGWAGHEFYDYFRSSIPQDLIARKVTSALLVDTNNATPKLISQIVNLNASRTNGCLGNVHLGMTMEQLVAVWGKPRQFWSRCQGGPLLCYSDVTVGFDPNRNWARRIAFRGSRMPMFEGGLSSASSMEDFMRVLGKASVVRVDGDECELVYKRGTTTLRLHFNRENLRYVCFEGEFDEQR